MWSWAPLKGRRSPQLLSGHHGSSKGPRVAVKLKPRPSIPVWLYGNCRTSGRKTGLYLFIWPCWFVCVCVCPPGLSLTHTHKHHPLIKMPGSSMRRVFALNSSSASSSHRPRVPDRKLESDLTQVLPVKGPRAVRRTY